VTGSMHVTAIRLSTRTRTVDSDRCVSDPQNISFSAAQILVSK
jgi:hypothetical protein